MTGDNSMGIRSELGQYAENETGEQFTRQNSKLLKVELSAGGVQALRGSMVAYQGDCLLYTSPSPRDATLSRMPSSA